MWVVANELEVLIVEVEDALHVRINLHGGQRTWLTGQLKLGLLDVVQIEVGVTSGMDEVTRFEARHLCHHLEQQGLARNVEGYAQESIC